MEQLRIIGKYAIAGAVALIFYAEPIDTDDLDLFFLHQTEADKIFSMNIIYEYFHKKGFEISDFTANIGGVRVQLIPSTGPLSDEAIQKARSVILFGVPSRVVEPEYLIALKLAAGRGKDFTHILHLLETSQEKIDQDLLDQLIARFHLKTSWDRFLGATLWTRHE